MQKPLKAAQGITDEECNNLRQRITRFLQPLGCFLELLGFGFWVLGLGLGLRMSSGSIFGFRS